MERTSSVQWKSKEASSTLDSRGSTGNSDGKGSMGVLAAAGGGP